MDRNYSDEDDSSPERSRPRLLWDRSKEAREIVSPVQRRIRRQRGLNRWQRNAVVKNTAQPDFSIEVCDNILFKCLYGISGLHIIWLLEKLTK